MEPNAAGPRHGGLLPRLCAPARAAEPSPRRPFSNRSVARLVYALGVDMLTQIPAGWIANRFGGKDILTVNMAGNALLLCLLPAAARMGQGVLCAALSVMGAFQGPLIPAQGAIKAAWLKGLGAERPFVLRVMGLGSKIASTLTGLAVPALATSRWGWRLVPYVYGITTAGMAIAWHCLASNAPTSSSEATAVQLAEAQAAADAKTADASKPPTSRKQPASTSAEWGIMSLLPVQATMWAVSAAAPSRLRW